MAKYDPIPTEEHVIRAVSWTRLRKDEHDNVLGCLWQAFQLRHEDTYLSTTWYEHFRSDLQLVVAAMRRGGMKITAKTGLAQTCVGKILDCGTSFGIKLRVLHDPTFENTGYSTILNVPREENELLEMLATDAVVQTTMVESL